MHSASKFDERRGNKREHVVCFFHLWDEVIDWTYTWYLHLMLRPMQDVEHLVSLFNTELCAEAKFMLACLARLASIWKRI